MKEKKAFSKTDKSIIYLFLAYLIVMLILFLPGYLKREHEKIYIITDRMQIKYTKGNWSKITNNKDYLLQEFNVYEDNNYLGNYKVVFNNTITLYDAEDNKVNYSGGLLAYRGTLDLEVTNYNYHDAIDDEDSYIIKKALSENKIAEDAYYSVDQKVSLDVDNDGIDEIIYNISNIKQADPEALDCVPRPVENSSNVNFSILFMYKNNKIYTINSVIENNQEFETFEIENILDVRVDGKKELLYAKGYPLNPSSECAFLYDLYKAKEIKNFCER